MAETDRDLTNSVKELATQIDEYREVLNVISATARGAEEIPLPLIKYGGKIVLYEREWNFFMAHDR